MSITYSIDVEKGIRIHTCRGTVDTDDILRMLREVYDDAAFSVSHNAVWDFRDCTANIPSTDLPRIVSHVRGLRQGLGGGRVALVVSTISDYGRARMYDMLSEYEIDRQLTVFKDYDEALRWIAKDDSLLPPE